MSIISANQKSLNMATTFVALYNDELTNFCNKVEIHTKPKQMVIYDNGPKTLMGTLYHTNQYTSDLLKSEILKQIQMATVPIVWSQKTWRQSSFIFKYPQLTNPWHRLIWASTNLTDLHFRGYINGSIQSGMNAALLVLSQFRPQVIDLIDYTDVAAANVILPQISVLEKLSTLFSFADIFKCSIGFLCIFICRSIYFRGVN